jgi:hypothetical protein
MFLWNLPTRLVFILRSIREGKGRAQMTEQGTPRKTLDFWTSHHANFRSCCRPLSSVKTTKDCTETDKASTMSLSPRGRAPVYQIDFMAVQSGKRIASTKRRIRWFVAAKRCFLDSWLPTTHNTIVSRLVWPWCRAASVGVDAASIATVLYKRSRTGSLPSPTCSCCRSRPTATFLYRSHISFFASSYYLSMFHRRFGFANTEALAAGETGTNCRGEEHDITLVWSLTSGKRMIIADGQEVHYSNSRANLFDFSWTMKGNNILKVVAHASPPLSPTPGFRQYDFFVNGQSFFSFPKVFRLGLTSTTHDPRDGGGSSPTSAGPPRVAESSKRYNRSASGSVHGIASIEAPGNPDEVSFS